MQEELGKYIADLLYRYDRLNIPGLGSFELSHAPALVDQVQGQVSAPAKIVRFNENLVLDDGILVDYLLTKNGWTLTESEAWLQERVSAIKQALAQKEIVELPGVGRFFRNFEQQLQFVAESENFNIDSFGLQPVRGQLISRSRAEKIPAAQPQSPKFTPPKAAVGPNTSTKTDEMAGGIASWFQRNLSWLLGLTLAVVILAIYLMFLRSGPEIPSPVADVPQERLNTSPSKEVPAEESEVGENPNTSTTEAEPPVAPQNNPTTELDTEAPTVAATEHTAVIAVGLFGNPENVQRLMQKLSEDGFAPVSRKEGSNTRIGVSVRFETEEELQRILREVRKEYAKSAFLLSRDGKALK